MRAPAPWWSRDMLPYAPDAAQEGIMTNDQIMALDREYVANTYGRFPVAIVSGAGAVCRDAEGRDYIDLGTGIAVNTFGYADEQWADAVTKQLHTLQHTSNLYYTEPCARLAEMLCRRTGLKKVFFGNSGAEANECAIKVARKYAQDKRGPEYCHIITLKNSFHGRTLTTLAATGQDVFHKSFTPLTPGFLHADAGDLAGVEKLVAEYKCAGILFEPVQGEGGVMPLDKAFVQGLRALCDREDLLLMADEVQTGNGRTGTLYAYMQYGVVPDVVTTAKGLAGGLPLGACMMGEKCCDVLGRGDHGSTFGGNPVACAGALSILSRLDEDLLAGVRARSEYIFTALDGAPGVESVSGLGLMIGIKGQRKSADVLADCRQRGVLCLTAKDRVRLLPPLNIPMDLLKKAVGILRDAFADI